MTVKIWSKSVNFLNYPEHEQKHKQTDGQKDGQTNDNKKTLPFLMLHNSVHFNNHNPKLKLC